MSTIDAFKLGKIWPGAEDASFLVLDVTGLGGATDFQIAVNANNVIAPHPAARTFEGTADPIVTDVRPNKIGDGENTSGVMLPECSNANAPTNSKGDLIDAVDDTLTAFEIENFGDVETSDIGEAGQFDIATVTVNVSQGRPNVTPVLTLEPENPEQVEGGGAFL